MMKTIYSLIFLLFLTAACTQIEAIDEFEDFSVTLINQDSVEVTFPDDYEGKTVVMGFIYTNCPDICPLITSNMKKIQKEMGNPTDVEFISISFDPQRDTPSVLSEYHDAFGMDEHFNFLTGDTAAVNPLLRKLRVRTEKSFSQINDDGTELYFLNHSDKLAVFDPNGRWVFEYGGSMTPADYVIDDIKQFRK